MSQTVTVPGIGDLEFPDGMSQPDMAAAIRRNFPQIHNDGRPTVPPVAAAPAPAPSITDQIVGHVQGALQVAHDTVVGLGGALGSGAGFLGGLAGALQTKLTGGVQPDSDAVRAVTGAPPRGTSDALDAAAAQGSAQVTGAMQAAESIPAIRAANPVAGVQGALDAMSTPQSQDVASDTAQGIQTFLSHDVDPGVFPALAAPLSAPANAAARGAGRVDAALNTAQTAAGNTVAAGGRAADAATGAVKTAAAKTVTKALPTPDPELVKTAQLADQFPHPMQIPPDRLLQPGVAKAVGQDMGTVMGGGGHALETANKQAFTKNLISLIDPSTDATRLTPETLDAAMDKSGATIGDIARSTDLPGSQIQSAFKSQVADAVRTGAGDVPRIIPNLADDLLSKVGDDGMLSGDAFQNWDSNIGRKIRQTTDPALAEELSNLQESARDVLQKNIGDPDQVQALKDARRQYAYGKIVAPDVAKTIDGLVDPGSLMGRVTATRNGKGFMASNAGGPIGDLAKVGKLLTNTDVPKAGTLPNAAIDTAKAIATPLRAGAAQVYNRNAGAVTRMLAPKAEPPAPEVPPEPPAPLALGYDPNVSSSGGMVNPNPLPVTPEGQAVAPGTEQARADLETSQRVAQGQGGTGAPPLATSYADYDTRTPDFQPPAVAAPATEPPSGLPSEMNALLDNGQRRTATMAQADARHEPSFPDAILEPDTAKTMVSGRPGETAATDTANVAMNEPGAVEARRQQSAATDAQAKAAADAEAAKPKPTPDEQKRLDEIDALLGSTQSDIVRETLTKARAGVEKDIAARDTVDKTKSAADELRAAAAQVTDKVTQRTMLARADKLDPPKPQAAAKAADEPLPSIEYADVPEWRQTHNLSPEDAARAMLTRQAHDVDPDAVERAAVQFNNSPRRFDREIDTILEKHRANQVQPPAVGGQGPATQAGKPGSDAGAAAQPARPHGAAAGATHGAGDQPAGPAGEASLTETDDEREARIKATPNAQRTDADLDWSRARSRAAAQATLDVQAQEEAAAAAARADTNGFAEANGDTRVQRARIQDVLNRPLSFGGMVVSRKDYIRQAVDGGATVEMREGQRALVNASGSHLLQDQISMTGMNFAEHLIKRKAQFERDHPRAPDGTFTDKE